MFYYSTILYSDGRYFKSKFLISLDKNGIYHSVSFPILYSSIRRVRSDFIRLAASQSNVVKEQNHSNAIWYVDSPCEDGRTNLNTNNSALVHSSATTHRSIAVSHSKIGMPSSKIPVQNSSTGTNSGTSAAHSRRQATVNSNKSQIAVRKKSVPSTPQTSPSAINSSPFIKLNTAFVFPAEVSLQSEANSASRSNRLSSTGGGRRARPTQKDLIEQGIQNMYANGSGGMYGPIPIQSSPNSTGFPPQNGSHGHSRQQSYPLPSPVRPDAQQIFVAAAAFDCRSNFSDRGSSQPLQSMSRNDARYVSLPSKHELRRRYPRYPVGKS